MLIGTAAMGVLRIGEGARILARSGQAVLEGLCPREWGQLANLMGGWVHLWSPLQVGSRQEWAVVAYAEAQMVQTGGRRKRFSWCPTG